jgi:hypothetical protein
MGRRATILSSLAIVAISSCGSPPAANSPTTQVPVSQQAPPPSAHPAKPSGSKTVELDVLAEGKQSTMKEPGFQAIRSARELDSFVRQADLKDVDTNVEWKDQMVLAVFAGDQPGSLDIASLQIKDDVLIAKASFQPASTTTASNARGAYMLMVVPKDVDDIDVRGLPEPAAAQSAASASPSPAASPAAAASPGVQAPVSVSPGQAQGQGQGSVQIIAQGPASGVRQPVNVIIRTNEEWQAVWGTHVQGAQGQAQPTVDLNQQSVIGIFLGEQAGVAGISLDSIQQTQTGGIQVKAHVLPGAATQGQMKASPYMLIAVPKLPAIPVDIQVQGGPQATTLGNPQTQQGAQPAAGQPMPAAGQPMSGAMPARPGFGQPVQAGAQPGFGQPVSGTGLGGMPGGISLGQGAAAAPPFPGRGSLLTGGNGGLLGPGGYQQSR